VLSIPTDRRISNVLAIIGSPSSIVSENFSFGIKRAKIVPEEIPNLLG
jgi:hypothetical protein